NPLDLENVPDATTGQVDPFPDDSFGQEQPRLRPVLANHDGDSARRFWFAVRHESRAGRADPLDGSGQCVEDFGREFGCHHPPSPTSHRSIGFSSRSRASAASRSFATSANPSAVSNGLLVKAPAGAISESVTPCLATISRNLAAAPSKFPSA